MASFNERGAGTYRCTFTKLDENFVITDKETQLPVTRWRWVFQETGDPTTVGEIDTITSPGFKKGSNGLRFLTGMLGRAPQEGDTTDALIGQEFDVQYNLNRANNLAIVGVTKPAPTGAGLPPALAAVEAKSGDLPF